MVLSCCFKMKKTPFISLFLAFTIVGCGHQPRAPVKVDPVDKQLLMAAKEIVRIRQKSAAIESASHSLDNRTKDFSYDARSLPESWQEEVILIEDFYGDVERFVRLVSLMAGMSEPRIYGTKPASPFPITIHASKRRVIDFLADAGHQVGDDVRVMPSIPINAVIIQYGIAKQAGNSEYNQELNDIEG